MVSCPTWGSDTLSGLRRSRTTFLSPYQVQLFLSLLLHGRPGAAVATYPTLVSKVRIASVAILSPNIFLTDRAVGCFHPQASPTPVHAPLPGEPRTFTWRGGAILACRGCTTCTRSLARLGLVDLVMKVGPDCRMPQEELVVASGQGLPLASRRGFMLAALTVFSAADFAYYTSFISLPSTPLWAGVHLMVTEFQGGCSREWRSGSQS